MFFAPSVVKFSPRFPLFSPHFPPNLPLIQQNFDTMLQAGIALAPLPAGIELLRAAALLGSKSPKLSPFSPFFPSIFSVNAHLPLSLVQKHYPFSALFHPI